MAEALEEHSVAKWELASLARREPDDERFDAKMSVLMSNVRGHIKQKEEFFPCLRGHCTRAELEALGDASSRRRRASPRTRILDCRTSRLVSPYV